MDKQWQDYEYFDVKGVFGLKENRPLYFFETNYPLYAQNEATWKKAAYLLDTIYASDLVKRTARSMISRAGFRHITWDQAGEVLSALLEEPFEKDQARMDALVESILHPPPPPAQEFNGNTQSNIKAYRNFYGQGEIAEELEQMQAEEAARKQAKLAEEAAKPGFFSRMGTRLRGLMPTIEATTDEEYEGSMYMGGKRTRKHRKAHKKTRKASKKSRKGKSRKH